MNNFYFNKPLCKEKSPEHCCFDIFDKYNGITGEVKFLSEFVDYSLKYIMI